MSLLIVERGCPNCGGAISDERLGRGLPCYRCLPEPSDDVCGALGSLHRLKALLPFCETERRLSEFEKFFEKAVGARPWSLQRLWAKRVFMGHSFAVVAPTGVGKTTFGLVSALFLKPKVLLIFPTRILASQAGNRLKELSEKLGVDKNVLVYESRKKVRERFLAGDFDVLCGTNMFLHKNFENLTRFSFSLIFIDDIDSFLKRSKNVDNLFKLLGFSESELKLALKENKTEKDWERLSKIRQRKRDTVLVVSSATLKPKGNRVFLFRNLLGFEVQKAVTTLRNIVDVAQPVKDLQEALESSADLIRRLGRGGLVYISVFYGKEKVNEVVEFYRSRGLKAISYLDYEPKELYETLEKGDFDVAVGISHITNPLVRGLDLPHVIRYAIFLDPPKHMFPTELSLQPSLLHSLLLTLLNLFSEEDRLKAVEYINYTRRYLTLREELLDRYPRVKERLEEIKEFLDRYLSDEEFMGKIERSEDISLVRKEGKLYVVVGDANSYIQASGRTSRFIAGGMTKGLSVLFYSDPKAFNSLRRRLSAYFMQSDVEFKRLEEIDLDKLLREIDEDRKRARLVLEGKVVQEIKDLFKTTLVVVESPNKARTIASFFGKPQMRLIKDSVAYEVPLGERLLVITASLGHVLDLVTDKGFFGVIAENGKFTPVYDTIKRCKPQGLQHTDLDYLKRRCRGKVEDKLSVVEALREAGYEVDEVFIATDPDAEGEKIAYDLYLLVRPFNAEVKRAEFHEVTPKAFREAVENPRELDTNLVKAQIVRRVLDRWVGFTLSRVLWKVFGKNWFSAGRVQTPVLGWIIERYKKSKEKKGEVVFEVNGHTFRAEIEDLDVARSVYEELELARVYTHSPREVEKRPLPPYATDTLLEDASERLKLSAQETMKLLQSLFEAGLITYHRTDSTRVSEAGRYTVAKPYISEKFGEELFYPRSWGEGGAHECIRPTRPVDPSNLRFMITAGLIELEEPNRALSLYELIFKRFMASQMRPAKVVAETLRVELPYYEWEEEVVTEVIEHGFDLIFPTFRLFEKRIPYEIKPVGMREVPKVPLFTQGTLIQEMKKKGLGRPSTYAHIVQTLLDRGYVKEVKGRLFPTKMGMEVYSYLREHYPNYVSEELTRELERAMDMVEKGEADYMEILKEAYRVKDILKELGEVKAPERFYYE
ncbi:reverse gyrase [Hydrogenivirga sp. 128-5-R1-1]|uniref:reverse gyrase n=1 Tax=Hydrogenivirga sp. 128-5-R1-1 TaxID=392423 RepID=UPI00015EF9AC|nr:reverse gyrase [Hydrogenivirga sp. 128-5-R1-1]EDP75277.1 reverse gyrase [Hydrogenivirga sp. 128-5-R1-1]